MSLLHHPVALDELYRMALLREAWTDFGDFGVVRRAGLRQIDNFSQQPSHPARGGPRPKAFGEPPPPRPALR